MVSSSGFEPLAFRLGGGRSILLSYEDGMKVEFYKLTFKRASLKIL